MTKNGNQVDLRLGSEIQCNETLTQFFWFDCCSNEQKSS